MKVYVQVVSGSVGLETGASLLVSFDKAKYLFNCGENVQRICIQNNVKISKFDTIFLTKNRWDTIGGLPGCILTAVSSGKDRLRVVGPPNLVHSFTTFREFVGRPKLDLELEETYSDRLVYEDEFLKVISIPILPCRTYDEAYRKQLDENLTCKDSKIEAKRAICSQIFNRNSSWMDPTESSEELKLEQELFDDPVECKSTSDHQGTPQHKSQNKSFLNQLVNCYLCQGNPVSGKFNLQSALALGLKPGKLFKELQAGNPVQNGEGKWITPEQCIDPSRPGKQFLIIDCPNDEYLEALIHHPNIAEVTSTVAMVFYILNDPVLEDHRFIEFVNRFHSDCQHIISSRSTTPNLINFRRAAKLQAGMHLMDKSIFSTPYHSTMAAKFLPKFDAKVKCTVALPDLIYHLEPSCKLESNSDNFWLLPTSELNNPLRKFETKLLSILGTDFKTLFSVASTPTVNYIGRTLISTLGTGSAIPSLTRNLSANLVKLADGRFVLLDVGEGTLGQLHRLVGDGSPPHPKLKVDIDTLLDKICLIYVSHPHADHHLGLISILQAIARLPNKTPMSRYLLAPKVLLQFLKEYNEVEVTGSHNFHLVDNLDLVENINSTSTQLAKESMLTDLHLKDLITCPVQHCTQSYGFKLTQHNSHTLIYSGDCRPDPNLIEMGTHCDLLIHEATLEDSMTEDAINKNHSTFSEAIKVGNCMQAKNVVLTHFSQRYPGISEFHNQLDQKFVLATDLAVFDVTEDSVDFERFGKIMALAKVVEENLSNEKLGV